MYITLEADYSVRIVDAIARSGERMVAKAIAKQACISQKFALQILHKLTTEGILRSIRGPHGGYEIAKPLEVLSVHDVLRAIEGPIVLNRCLLETNTCTRVPDKNCPYHRVFKELSELVSKKLASISFADVLNAEIINSEK